MKPIEFSKDWIRQLYLRAGRYNAKIKEAINAATPLYNPPASDSPYIGVDAVAVDREIAWFSIDRKQVHYQNSENGPFRVKPKGEDEFQIDLRAPVADRDFRVVGDMFFAEFKQRVVQLSPNAIAWSNERELRGTMDSVLRRSIEWNWTDAFANAVRDGLHAEEKNCIQTCAERCVARLEGGNEITVPVLINAIVETSIIKPIGVPPGRICVPG